MIIIITQSGKRLQVVNKTDRHSSPPCVRAPGLDIIRYTTNAGEAL